MKDALLLVDVLNDFEHEDGERLLVSFRQRHDGIVQAVRSAREGGVPVVYAQDNRGVWDGDGRRLVQEALDGSGGDLLEALAPAEGESLVVKPRYSAFDKTPLELVLRDLEVERLLLAGAATEGWRRPDRDRRPGARFQDHGARKRVRDGRRANRAGRARLPRERRLRTHRAIVTFGHGV